MAASKDKIKKAVKRLSDKDIFVLVSVYRDNKAKENTAKAAVKKAQVAITDELLQRKTKSLTASNGTTVTLVQPESVEYDADGLYSDLKPKQRREVFEDNINLNALPKAKRIEILDLLTKDEREEITTHVLVVDKLSSEVQAGNIDAKTVAKHSSIKKSSPYIRIGQAGE